MICPNQNNLCERGICHADGCVILAIKKERQLKKINSYFKTHIMKSEIDRMQSQFYGKEVGAKGDELIEIFYKEQVCHEFDKHGDMTKRAVCCAIICVEKIILALKKKEPSYQSTTYWHPIDFYEQVLIYLTKNISY